MAEIAAKVMVVGGGPGGYVCAIRAGQHSVTTPCNPDFLGGCYVIMFTGLQGVGQSQ